MNIKYISPILAISILLSGCGFGSSHPEISFVFFDVGKADSMIIESEYHSVMIDCGLKKDGLDLVDYCDENDIRSIDYLILTHYDKDHIGGAAKLIENVHVNKVLMPDYSENSKTYYQLMDTLAETNTTYNIMKSGSNDFFTIDNINFAVYASEKNDYGENDDNDFSLVTTAKYYDNSFIFAGDAMEQRTDEIINQNLGHFDLLKVQYHGREISNFSEFLDSITPKYAVVSTSEDEYSKSCKKALKSHDVKTYTTFDDGDIVFTSNGEKISAYTYDE